MNAEFDPTDDTPTLRVVKARQVTPEAPPATALLEVLKQIPPLLSALLTRGNRVTITSPPADVKVAVNVAPRPCRTRTMEVIRDGEGRFNKVIFTESDN